MAHVLFVCLHNAGRSQMSRALFERAAGGRHTSESAGSVAEPGGDPAEPSASCCDSSAVSRCCEPAAKSSCCGSEAVASGEAPSSCGCVAGA